MDIPTVLLGIGLVILFGFLSEFIFKKTGVPDLLLLMILGFVLGPGGWGIVQPSSFSGLAYVFTTFALLFILFEGALSIDLNSFGKEIMPGVSLALFNFFMSSGVLFLLLNFLFGFETKLSLLLAFALSGVSSAFVVPILEEMKIGRRIYTILTLESAITDIFTIVFSLTAIKLLEVSSFSLSSAVTQVLSLFSVAGVLGIIGAVIWIFIDKQIIKEHRSYMSTIAFLLVLFYITEYLGGNGPLAALFFGLMLRNSGELQALASGMTKTPAKHSFSALTESERFFHSQISFFLKTFFFVFIGLLLNFKDLRVVLIGAVLSISIMLVRNANLLVTKGMAESERSLVNAMFAIGIAAATVMQMTYESGVLTDPLYIDIAYFVIFGTTILSSLRVFIHKHIYAQ